MKLQKILALALLPLALTAFAGCSPVEDEAAPPNMEQVVLRIGMMSSTDVIPYVLMDDMDIDEKYGIDLELETFTSAKDRDAALQAGELDGVLTDFIGVCMYQNAGFDVKITGITDGDYILMAGKNTGITDISQINGKSIAISENTLIDYTLDKILEAKGLATTDVTREIVPRIPDRLELLRNDKIDLGLMPEPFASLGIADGSTVLGSANEVGLYPAVSAFTAKALEEKYAAICNLYTAYNETVEYINSTDIREYDDEIIDAVGYPEEMKEQLTQIKFRKSALPAEAEVADAVKWASGRGLCEADLTYDQMVSNVY